MRPRASRVAQLPERSASLPDCCTIQPQALQRGCSMAESALSRVIALTNKGTELGLRGHHARAAEKFSLAAEEAERGPSAGGPDCLITAALRTDQIDALLGYSTASAAKPTDANDVLRKACFHLLPAVEDVLQRRKAAGTLLPGTCRSDEVAWFKAERRHCRLLQGMSLTEVEEGSTRIAPYVGYTTFMRLAASVAFVLNNIVAFKCALNLSNEELDAHICKAMLYLASALDLMTLPRPELDETWMAGEPEVVRLTKELSPVFTSMADSRRRTELMWRSSFTTRGAVCCAAACCVRVESTTASNRRISIT